MVILKELARSCDFGEALEDMLRDRLVCGTHSDPIRNRLLSERDFTFQRALELSLSIESALAASKELSQKGQTVNMVGKPIRKYSPRKQVCWRCGGPHAADCCWFKTEFCHICGEKGHTSRRCARKKSQKSFERTSKSGTQGSYKPGQSPLKSSKKGIQSKKAHMVEEYESYESGSDKESIWALNHVGSNREAILVKVNIEGKEIPLELDTGSNVSIMPSNMYNEQFCHLELEHTSAEFEGYFGAVPEATRQDQC